MARIRTIKPEFWEDEKLSEVPLQARLLFIGCWNFADDFGVLPDSIKWIKAKVFPYDTLRDNDVKQWCEALVKNRMLVPFQYGNKGYYIIRRFRSHQIIDKRYEKSLLPLEIVGEFIKHHDAPTTCLQGDYHVNTMQEVEGKGKELERKGERLSPNGDEGTSVPSAVKNDPYKAIVKDKAGIFNYIIQAKPTDIRPYVDFWNMFATEKKFPLVSKINDSRKRKFANRIKDPAFDFPSILRKAGKSEFIAQSNWFTFDWIIENENNFLKVLEGKFDKKENEQQENGPINKLNEKIKAASRKAQPAVD